MSIYGRRKGLMDYEAYQRTPQARDAEKTVAGAQRNPNDDRGEDWVSFRRARPADYLLPIGERWLRGLPPEVLPVALITTFPRIVNLFAMQWDDRNACSAYFEELLTDRRGGRRGFPENVERDLSRLRSYWYSRTTPTIG